MPSHKSLKKEFLKKWLMGLQICNASKKGMSLLERKKAIKLSGDVAIAAARNTSTCWSRALIANAAKDEENKILVDLILGVNVIDSEKIKKASTLSVVRKKIVLMRSKKILKKCRGERKVKKMAPQMAMASSIAKRLMVKKKTQVLKRLVPGGESMDELSLIEETLDYVVSLRAQIDVMRSLANASGHFNPK